MILEVEKGSGVFGDTWDEGVLYITNVIIAFSKSGTQVSDGSVYIDCCTVWLTKAREGRKVSWYS